MHVCYDPLLLLYDCRNYKGDYLGRALVALDFEDNPDNFQLQRHVLDSDSILKDSCTWKYKSLDCSLVKDYGEFDYDA